MPNIPYLQTELRAFQNKQFRLFHHTYTAAAPQHPSAASLPRGRPAGRVSYHPSCSLPFQQATIHHTSIAPQSSQNRGLLSACSRLKNLLQHGQFAPCSDRITFCCSSLFRIPSIVSTSAKQFSLVGSFRALILACSESRRIFSRS